MTGRLIQLLLLKIRRIMSEVDMDAEKIRKEFGYIGKPLQWKAGFDALLKHMPGYIKEELKK